MIVFEHSSRSRRAFLKKAFASMALGSAGALVVPAALYQDDKKKQYPISDEGKAALEKYPDRYKDKFRITKLEAYKVYPRWLFLKVHTDQGITGLGEPLLEGRADTVITAIKEIEPYLLGQDPRRVMHHWQAIYRHAFYRGGPILTSALSGIEQALWDIKGKALGVPVYELLGGPTRHSVKVYARGGSPEEIIRNKEKGFIAFKTGVLNARQSGIIASPSFVRKAEERFASLREAGGEDVDIAIDFHGAVSPQNASLLIKALEPYQPFFIEEPVQCQNVDVMADLARKTHIPIATGERIFTKWGFREILEKGAASILQPDLCHAGGIFEARLIAGMAEAYYYSVAPHNPMGPISLAAGIQLAASVPNFLCQEQKTLGEGYLKNPFEVEEGYVRIPDGPGLGIELDEDAIEDKLGHEWRNPETYNEEDGSVVDW
jgi:galactonate dehydratase